MPDVTESYGKSLDFIVFFCVFSYTKLTTIMSGLLYLHQTFTDCVIQMSLQVMEGSLI